MKERNRREKNTEWKRDKVKKEKKIERKKEKERTYTKEMKSRRFENIIFLIKKQFFVVIGIRKTATESNERTP